MRLRVNAPHAVDLPLSTGRAAGKDRTPPLPSAPAKGDCNGKECIPGGLVAENNCWAKLCRQPAANQQLVFGDSREQERRRGSAFLRRRQERSLAPLPQSQPSSSRQPRRHQPLVSSSASKILASRGGNSLYGMAPQINLHASPGHTRSLHSLPSTRLRPASKVAVQFGTTLFPSTKLGQTRSLMAAAVVSKGSTSAGLANRQPSKDVIETWRKTNAVCFDVDSTVCLDEGIDELADFCGSGQAVAEWTARAMTGTVPFEDALAARLSLIKPSISQVEECLEKRPPRISPGMPDLIKKLKANNIDVFLVSGGFRQMIKPVALELGIPPENIVANQLLFGTSGEYAGFDPTEPTSRSGGKALAVQQIRQKHGYDTVIMIGDGATDLEARQPGGAELFICYAGVQMREAVAAKADWVVFDFQEMITQLP